MCHHVLLMTESYIYIYKYGAVDRSVPRARALQTVADIVDVRPLWTNVRRFGLPSLSQAPCRPFIVIFFFCRSGPNEPALITGFFSTLASLSSIPRDGGRTCSHLLFGASLANSCWITIFFFLFVRSLSRRTHLVRPLSWNLPAQQALLESPYCPSFSPCHDGRTALTCF